MEKLREINFKELFKKVKKTILEHKVISIVIVCLLFLTIVLAILNSANSVKSLVIEFSNSDNLEMHYSPFFNDNAVMAKNSKIEVKFTTNPSNKKVATKCYYDKNIISFNNNIITPKRGGTTEFYCVAGFLNKTKSNVIDIEVK
ncbi:MAG: hypothetical protein J6A17_00575 [Bacilli bacterium]|nr:hypothetical protein [Bacilli bacterium]